MYKEFIEQPKKITKKFLSPPFSSQNGQKRAFTPIARMALLYTNCHKYHSIIDTNNELLSATTSSA
jgi:hypothetical protein